MDAPALYELELEMEENQKRIEEKKETHAANTVKPAYQWGWRPKPALEYTGGMEGCIVGYRNWNWVWLLKRISVTLVSS